MWHKENKTINCCSGKWKKTVCHRPDQHPKFRLFYNVNQETSKNSCIIWIWDKNAVWTKPCTPFSQTLDVADDSVCWTNRVLQRSPDYCSARMCLQVLCLLLSRTDLQHVRAPLKQQPGEGSFAGSAAHGGDFILAPTCEEFHFRVTHLYKDTHIQARYELIMMPLGLQLE